MAYSERRKIQPTVARKSEALELKKAETKQFAQDVAAVVQSGAAGISAERQAELQRLRDQAQAELQKKEAESRTSFEESLESSKEAAREEYAKELEGQKDFESRWQPIKSQAEMDFERQLASAKAAERMRLQASIHGQVRQAQRMGVPVRIRDLSIAQAKAEASVEKGLADWETQQKEAFAQNLTSMKQQAKTQYEQEFSNWQTEQWKQYDVEVGQWESQARKLYEYGGVEPETGKTVEGIQTWKQKSLSAVESSLTQYGKEWKARGIAERLMDIKIPNLQQLIFPQLVKTQELITGTKTPTAIAPIAGVIGSFESLAYGVAGILNIPSPRAPPTLTSGLISSVILSGTSMEMKASPEMEQAMSFGAGYALGNIVGDILISKGISAGVKTTWKGVKSIASYVYEGSGLKYSTALYKTREAVYGFSQKYIPSWSLKRSSVAYWFQEKVTRKLPTIPKPWQKPSIALGLVGQPTVVEGEVLSASEMFGTKGYSAIIGYGSASERWAAVGWAARRVTPLQAASFAFEAMQVPKTAGIGLTTVAQQVVGKGFTEISTASAMAEEYARYHFTIGEKWALRAGLKAPIIVAPEEQAGLRMIKGGRYFRPETFTETLGFTRARYVFKESASAFAFQKATLPKRSIWDLLKETKAQTTLVQLTRPSLEIAPKVLTPISLAAYSMKSVSSEAVFGLGAISLRAAVFGKPKPISREISKPAVGVASVLSPAQSPFVSQVSRQKMRIAQPQLQAMRAIQQQLSRTKPSVPTFRIPRPSDEDLKRRKKAAPSIASYIKRRAHYVYPVATASQAALMVLGRSKPKRRKK